MAKQKYHRRLQSEIKQVQDSHTQTDGEKFFKKMKEIEVRQQKIAELEARLLEIQAICAPIVQEYENEVSELEIEIVQKLNEHLHNSKLSRNVKSRALEMIIEIAHRLIDKGAGERIQTILDDLFGTEEEEVEAVEFGKFNDSADEKIEEDFFEFDENGRGHSDKQTQTLQSNKKGSDSNPVKDLYRGLAKLCHPDLEQDSNLKIEKTRMMQKATAAYNQNDLFTLLQIQAQALSGKADIPSHFYSHLHLLDEKLCELKDREVELKRNGPLAFFYKNFFGKKDVIVQRKQRTYEAFVTEEISLLVDMQEQIKTVKGVKEFFSDSIEYETWW